MRRGGQNALYIYIYIMEVKVDWFCPKMNNSNKYNNNNTIKSALKASSALYGKGKHGQTISNFISAVFCQMKVHLHRLCVLSLKCSVYMRSFIYMSCAHM